MKRSGLTIFKNAVANLVRGGAQAAVALALPHFLVHTLDAERFSAWSLMLQIAAYASFLDFGIQVAVSRFIAQALELDQHERVRKLIETAVVLLSIAALIALLAIAAVALFAGSLFHGVPTGLLREFQISTLVLACGAAFLLPLSTFTGVLVGMHRNEFPALAIGLTRIVGAVAAIASAHYSPSLVRIALCIAIPNVVGGLLQFAVVYRHLPTVRGLRLSLDRTTSIEFLRYCSGLTVWSVGMFFVMGLDVTIVGHFQFAAVGYYALCATLMTIFASVNGTIMNAFLAPFAAMHARREFDKTRDIVVRATRINTALNLVVLALAIVYGERLLTLWVGPTYAHAAFPILIVLTIAQSIRLMGSAFAVALMGTGHQNANIPPVIVEALINLVASLCAVVYLGPIGVAWGSLIGSAVQVPTMLLASVKRRPDLIIDRKALGVAGMAAGLLAGAPVVAWSVFVYSRHLAPWTNTTLLVVSVAVAATLFRLLDRRSGRTL